MAETNANKITRLERWRVDALKAAEQLLSEEYLERLRGEAWWRAEVAKAAGKKPPRDLDTPHFLPTRGR